jgi:hypothetical protein
MNENLDLLIDLNFVYSVRDNAFALMATMPLSCSSLSAFNEVANFSDGVAITSLQLVF